MIRFIQSHLKPERLCSGICRFPRVFIFLSLLLTSFPAASFSVKPEMKTKKRSHIHIVGSSTVYPFSAVIAETFGRDTEFRTPIVEATGTGGGFKFFCSGVGFSYPDFVNASRRIEVSEVRRCLENNIKEIVEIKIGYDGITLAKSNSGPKFQLTKTQIFLALAEKIPDKNTGQLIENPYTKWRDIDLKLPDVKIRIYGPPSTSGTRDAFSELVMEEACINMEEFVEIYPDKKIRGKKCRIIRSDGAFIEAGENDNLIIQKLRNDNSAFGIFGFNFLEENRNLIQPSLINGFSPTLDNIASAAYPISRPLFIYFKKEHLNLVPGMKEFIHEIISENTIGKDGYLLQKGLIPLSDFELKQVQNEVLKAIKTE